MLAAVVRVLRPAIVMLIAMTVITGILYPAAVTAVAQGVFPSQANGSMIVVDGTTVGSSLIGQYFGPTSEQLIDTITARVDAQRAANGGGPVPVDLVTSSASGLDPDISPAAAEYQVARVAKARGMTEDQVRAYVARHTEQPFLWFLGEPRVHVLELNLDLDGLLK
jgi:K+-transporting ATPase ATPase C chain